MSTALGGLALPIGCILGFVLPVTLIGADDAYHPVEGKKKVNEYILIQNCIVTVATIPLLIFARDKPPTPPSAAASRREEPLNFKSELKALMSNRSYLLLCVTFTTLYGVYTAVGAVVNALTEPYGYTPGDNAIFGGIFIFFGVTGSFVLGIVIDRTQKFKLTINVISTLAVIFIGCGLLTLPLQSTIVFSANLAFIGFTVIPIIPISYGFAVELTFPTPEAMSNGMMILPSQIFGASMVRFFLSQISSGGRGWNNL